jgi:hypothetical protein
MTGTNLKTKAKPAAETRCLGYARISTYGQTLDAQLEQLRRDGCTQAYKEKVSGARTDRRQLFRMLKGGAPVELVEAGSFVTLRWRGTDSNLRFRDALAPPTARPWCDAA